MENRFLTAEEAPQMDDKANESISFIGNTILPMHRLHPDKPLSADNRAQSKQSSSSSSLLSECQMRTKSKLFVGSSLELVELRCRRRRIRNGKLNGFTWNEVIALLVCIFGFVLVVCANHIHQKSSHSIEPDESSSTAKPLHHKRQQSIAEYYDNWIADKERIQVRHNFTARVNGREVALKPPSTDADETQSAMASGESQKVAKKVNREGDSPIDYESGFELNDSDQTGGFDGPTSHSSALMSSSSSPSSSPSSSYSPQVSNSNSNTENDSVGSISSSSSSLDSRNKDKEDDLDREMSNGKTWRALDRKPQSSQHRNNKQQQQQQQQQYHTEGSKQNRIISDWPKNLPVGRERSPISTSSVTASTEFSPDRHYSWSQNYLSSVNSHQNNSNIHHKRQQQSNLQLGHKYSALLSSQANANELASQPGDSNQHQQEQKQQHRWDNNKQETGEPIQQQPLTGRIKFTISSRLAQTIKPSTSVSRKVDEGNNSNSSSSINDVDVDVDDTDTDRLASSAKTVTTNRTGKRGSSGRKQTIRAPVHARQRYSFASSSIADAKTNELSPVEPTTNSATSLKEQDNPIEIGQQQQQQQQQRRQQRQQHIGNIKTTRNEFSRQLGSDAGTNNNNNSTKKDSAAPTVSYEIPSVISNGDHRTNLSSILVSSTQPVFQSSSSLSSAKSVDSGSSRSRGQIIGDSEGQTSSGSSSNNNNNNSNNTGKSAIVQRDLSRVLYPPPTPPPPPPTVDSGREAWSLSSTSRFASNDAFPSATAATTAAAVALATGGASISTIGIPPHSNAIHSANITNNNQLPASAAGSSEPYLQRLDMVDSAMRKHSFNNRNSEERMGSIVRTGPILTHSSHQQHSHNLNDLVPAAMALLAQAHQADQQSRPAATIRMLHQQSGQQQHHHGGFIWPPQPHLNDESSTLPGSTARATVGLTGAGTTTTSSLNESQLFGVDQMIATANHLGVAHLGPQTGRVGQNIANLGVSETGSYNSISDYTDRVAADSNLQNNYDPSNSAASSSNAQQPISSAGSSNISGEEQRFAGGYPNDYPNDSDQNNLLRSHQTGGSSDSQLTNSRSSISDPFMRSDHKATTRESSVASYSPIRGGAGGSIDPFEDITGGLSSSDYERDLADLDEEFNRQAAAQRRPTSQLMADSYVSLSPERYEARRYNRRPSYDYGAGEYLTAAGSMSSIIPRAYPRSPAPWPSSAPYSESSDLWSDTSLDYSPLMSPSHYAYRWRPRYQRIAAYPGGSYLAAAASEQQFQPGYSILPAYPSASNLQPTTETISFALSPLAAAAAAAASALAAADKSRHQGHAWLTLPRLTTTGNAAGQQNMSPSSPTSSASNQHASTVPAATLPATAYLSPHRPGPYAFSPIPIYAFAPRPPTSSAAAAAALSATGSATAPTPAMIPFFPAVTPTLLAYRTAGMVPGGSLLTAASFAYPFRMPITTATMGRPPIPLAGGAATASSNRPLATYRPYLTDLQFAETKYKTNMNNSSSDSKSGFAKSSSTLSAMAKNFSKKVFGSASQLRPQHVAPPTNSGYELYSSSPSLSGGSSTALGNLSQSIIK